MKQTTIILGAGASADYGFPTGKTLISEVIEFCERQYNNNYLYSDLKPAITHFGKVLSDTDPLSIDSFLALHEDNKDFVDIGKKLIAANILLYHEHLSMTHKNPNNWYKILYSYLSQNNYQAIFNHEVQIITFNYDLSLEYYFERQLELNPKLTPEMRSKYLNAFLQRVLHFYGSVYDYLTPPKVPKMNEHQSIQRYCDLKDFSLQEGKCLINVLRDIPSNIKIIGEERDIENCPSHKAHLEYLRNSGRVFILGFGFDMQNIKLLQLVDPPEMSLMSWKQNCEVLYTNYDRSYIIDGRINDMGFAKKSVHPGGCYEALTTAFTF